MKLDKWKVRALTLIRKSKPNPFFVTLCLLAATGLFYTLMERLPTSLLVIDYDAIKNLDREKFFILDWNNFKPFADVLYTVMTGIIILLDYGYVRYALKASRLIKTDYSELLSGFEFPLQALILTILEYVVISFLTFLFIVPGIIAAYNYSMARRLLCDHPDWTPFRCMRESRLMMRGHRRELLEIQISFLPWWILVLIPFTLIFSRPYFCLTINEFYFYLTDEVPPDILEDDDDESSLW